MGMNELMYVFAPSALIAAGMGGWALKGFWDGRQTKAALLKKAEEAISALEEISKKTSNAQAAADAATLEDLQKRFSAL
jgi:hypothetical protein